MTDEVQYVFGMEWGTFVTKVVTLAVTIALALLVQHIVVKVCRRALDASKVPSASIFINLLRALIWSFALLCVLEPVFGVQPTAFVAALGITSVVISFGLQDTISNVISGLGLMIGHVVEPGDRVKVGDVTGVVTDVTWRHTIVRNVAGDDAVIPNSQLNKTALVRLSTLDSSECVLELVIDPSSDLDQVASAIEQVVSTTLGDRVNREFGCKVRFVGTDVGGVRCKTLIHVGSDVDHMVACDEVMRALSGSPWLARTRTVS